MQILPAAAGRLGIDDVIVLRKVGLVERHRRRTALLSDEILRKPGPLALLDTGVALEVGQSKGGRSIAAVVGAEEREQRRILRDGQYLSIAGRPADGREVKSKDPDFAEIRVAHESLSNAASFGSGKCPEGR